MGVAPINSSVLHLSRVCLSALNSKLDFSRMSPYLQASTLLLLTYKLETVFSPYVQGVAQD